MQVTNLMMACQDCLLYVANGDEPDDRDIEADIQDYLGHASGLICCGDTENDNEFSWRVCECCGSHLGGSRHELIVLGE
jgi:hypothetical protein